MIAEFVSDDGDQIEERKLQIPEDEWAKCLSMGQAYLQQSEAHAPRDGHPWMSLHPSMDAGNNEIVPGAVFSVFSATGTISNS